MAFSVYEVVRVACLPVTWIVCLRPVSPGAYKTNQLRDWQATRTTSSTVKAIQGVLLGVAPGQSYINSSGQRLGTFWEVFHQVLPHPREKSLLTG